MEHVILFGGPMGAGKTTAIETLSDIEVVRTEAANSERDRVDKPTTTVALDYGEILVSESEKVRLYGIPGQRRFDFMWRMLSERAEGMVLLINADAPHPVEECLSFLADFAGLVDRGGVVVGVTRTDLVVSSPTLDLGFALASVHPELIVPVLPVDPRNTGQMRILLMTLIANLEVRELTSAARAHA